MDIGNFLEQLYNEKGILVSVQQDELKLKGNQDSLTPEIINGIKNRKSDILNYLNDRASNSANNFKISKAQEKNHYTLSSAQRRLYFLYALDKNSTAYNVFKVVKLEGKLDTRRLENSFRKLITRHESLRTRFEVVGEEVVQKVRHEEYFSMTYYDASEADVEPVIDSFVRPFDLGQSPLFRVGLIKVRPVSFLLMLDMHHIITDGISQEILIKELVGLYGEKTLPPIPICYKDYAEWEQHEEQRKRLSKQEDFWLREFEDEVIVLDLPTDYHRPMIKTYKGNMIGFSLGQEDTSRLKRLSEHSGATMFMTLLSVFYVLLSKLGNQDDIVVGTPVAGRPHISCDGVVGMFANTLPLRNFPKGELDFNNFLAQVRDKVLSCLDNQFYPYNELIDKLQLARDTSRNPLFEVMFVYQNYASENLSIPGLELKGYEQKQKASKFDLTLSVTETVAGLQMSIEYSSALFERRTIDRFIGYFHRVVAQVIKDPQTRIGEIEILSSEEKDQLINGLNDTHRDYPADQTVIDLFEEQVLGRPDAIAAIARDGSESYASLNHKANQLAQWLISNGLTPQAPVVVLTERSIDMLAAIIGIFKSGGCYVPVSVDYPADRIGEVISDTATEFVITSSRHVDEKLLGSLEQGAGDISVICLDVLAIKDRLNSSARVDGSAGKKIAKFIDKNDWREMEVDNPCIGVKPGQLAYILYTSGSTGRPKGVMIEHGGMLNHLLAKRDALQLDAGSVVAQNASETFDISIWQFLAALVVGGKTVVCSKELVLEPRQFLNKIHADKVNILEVVPSYLSVLMDNIVDTGGERLLSGLRYLLVTGEVLKKVLVERWFDLYPDIKMVNAYGPTEASDDITHCILDRVPAGETVPIGRAVSNMKIYIVDEGMDLCPIGVKGEIVVSGIGVGRGYLNREEETAAAFMQDPFSQEYRRMYRTGDIGSRLSNGDLTFHGRIDNQVKINGYRIELGEIEQHICAHNLIRDSVVTIREEADKKCMVGYYISQGEVDATELRGYLMERLPEFMVPSYFVEVDSMPLTFNGKINRDALPDPGMLADNEHAAPDNEIERKLVDIWSDILGIEPDQISTRRSFFELGGNSFNAMILVNKIAQVMHAEVRLRDVFAFSNVKSLASTIEAKYWLDNQQESRVIKKSKVVI